MENTGRPTGETSETMEALMAKNKQEARRGIIWAVALTVAAVAASILKTVDVSDDRSGNTDCKGVVDCIDKNIEKGSDGVLRVVPGAETFSPKD